jgi:hypothetical protein
LKLLVRSLSLCAVLAFAGCSRSSLIGESCLAAADCGGGLVCFNMKCGMGSTGYAPTGKVCVALQCRDNTDCITPLTCSGGKCVCSQDMDCGFGRRCVSGACVTCSQDSDCTGTDQVCVNGACRNKCIDNFDCADFYTCEGGRCTFSGCKADKDCAVSTRDSRSKCDMTAKTCFLPCSADVECGTTTGGAWFGQVCSKGRCENVGCDKAEDCQTFLPTGTAGDCVTPPTP